MVRRITIDREGYPFETDNGEYVKYDDYAEIKQTLGAARSYVVLDARRGDAHAIGLLRAIDKALKDD